MQDDSSDFDKEEIECAIALSLAEEDVKGKKVIGKLHCCKSSSSYFLVKSFTRFKK